MSSLNSIERVVHSIGLDRYLTEIQGISLGVDDEAPGGLSSADEFLYMINVLPF